MDYMAVAIAGFLGAVTRAALGKLVKGLVDTVFPLNTFLINLTGCFVLSFFFTITLDRLRINPKLRLAIGTGFLGAYATFSTFAVESVNLIQGHQIWISLLYILGTSLGCVVMAGLGAVLSRLLTGHHDIEVDKPE